MQKFLILFPALLALSACSHSATKPEEKTAAPAAKAAKAAPAPAKVAAKKAASADGRVCRKGSDERKLEVVNKDSGCVLKYTKAGETKDMASAEHTGGYCEKVLEKMAGHLENAGYTCN
jgi:hypothetical protein